MGPVIPVAPVGPVAPIGPMAPAGPVGPVGPSAPSGPRGPPAGPVGPVAPGSPRGPTSPCAPVGPVAPAGPVSPMAPRGPVGPIRPTGPVAPVGPVGPTFPPQGGAGTWQARAGQYGQPTQYRRRPKGQRMQLDMAGQLLSPGHISFSLCRRAGRVPIPSQSRFSGRGGRAGRRNRSAFCPRTYGGQPRRTAP